jgi:hypothetical protein
MTIERTRCFYNSLFSLFVVLSFIQTYAALANSSAYHEDHETLAKVTLEDVVNARADDEIKRAFFGQSASGVLFVTDIKGFAEVRARALSALALCATKAISTEDILGFSRGSVSKENAFKTSEKYAKDHRGVKRSTIASFSNKRLSMDVSEACMKKSADANDDESGKFDLRRELEKLRDFADLVSRATLPRIDFILNDDDNHDNNHDNNHDGDLQRRSSRFERNFFSDALRSEASLDHFHVYESEKAREENINKTTSKTVVGDDDVDVNNEKSKGKHEHTDVGIAIIMTPAWVSGKDDDAPGNSRGLLVDGVAYDIPSDGMLVLLGEAARAWHPRRHNGKKSLLDEIKIPTHAVALEKGETRSWFGRMVLPNLNDQHPDSRVDLNFGEWLRGARELVTRYNNNQNNRMMVGNLDEQEKDAYFVSAACDGLPTRKIETTTRTTTNGASSEQNAMIQQQQKRRILADDGDCDEGTILCWLSCQAIPTGCNSTTAVCQVSGSNEIKGGSEHCDSCTPACPAVPNEVSGGQCNSNIAPTTMFMDGFSSGNDSNQPCVAFFFESWALKTKALVFAACLFTIFLGMSIEFTTKLRRKVRASSSSKHGQNNNNNNNTSTLTINIITLLLYATQVTAGYLLMLVSMTYHVPLFLSVIIGLTLGHALFSVYSSDAHTNKITSATTACCADARDSDQRSDGDTRSQTDSLERGLVIAEP